MQIAVDGPAGAGKSTAARALAQKLGCIYLDTGAMYRAVAYKALKAGERLEGDNARLGSLARNSTIEFKKQKVFIDGEDVTEAIRTPEVSAVVSAVSSNKEVREVLAARQREIAGTEDVVMDGRDIATVVLPDAEYKFYIDASPQVRALRRALEMGINPEDKEELESLKEQMVRRDWQDKHKEVGALIQAEDAVYIKTDELSADGVVELMLEQIKD